MRVLIFFIFFNSFGVYAQDAPKLKFEKYHLDLGDVHINSSKEWRVNLKNDGNAKLFLHKVEPNCSCVKVSTFPKELLPEEVGDIRGYVKSGSKGEVMKFISIGSNDSSGDQKLSVRVNFI